MPRSLSGEVADTIYGYFTGQAKIAAILTVVYLIGFAIAGAPWWFLLAPVCAFLHLVPVFGAVIALLLAEGAVFLADGTLYNYCAVLAVYVLAQALEGFWLTPRILGRRLRLSPILVFFAVIAGGALFGFFGVLLAVPVLAIAAVIWRHRAAAAVALLGVIASSSEAQDEVVPLFKSEVSLVRVDLRVSGPDGVPIGDLRQKDFLLSDEHQPQEIRFFDRTSEPLHVLMLLDVSGSMAPALREVASSARTALAQLRPGDQAGVMMFASRAQVIQPFTGDFSGLPRKIVSAAFQETLGRTTMLNEALLEAAKYTSSAAGGRKAIIVVTDNESARGSVSDAQVVRALHNADAVLDAIIVGSATGASPGRYTDPSIGAPNVFAFAEQTGGSAVKSAQVGDLLTKLLKSIRTMYTLQYAGPTAEPGSFRRIHVELSPEARARFPRANIEARSGYHVAR